MLEMIETLADSRSRKFGNQNLLEENHGQFFHQSENDIAVGFCIGVVKMPMSQESWDLG